MTLEMTQKRLRFVKLPSVVGPANAAVPSEHAQPDMHLFSDSEDREYDSLPDGEDQQYFVAHCSSMSQLLEDFHC